MAEMVIAAAGLTAGAVYGRHQLIRWEIWSQKSQYVLAVGVILIFVPGCCLMKIYGYHSLKMIRYWILMYGLLLLAMADAKKKIIPNKALLFMSGARTILIAAECMKFRQLWMEIIISAAAGLAGGGLLFLLAGIVIRKGMGMGDVKLIAVIGYYLGFQVLMSDLVITLTLTVAAGLIILILGKGSLHSEMPFAPFAAVGTIITLLMGF